MHKGLLISLILTPLMVNAQFKPVSIGEGTNTAIVINKKNPQNIVLASSTGIYSSVDDGVSWQKKQGDDQSRDNLLISDRKGSLFEFHLSLNTDTKRYDKIICQTSEDGGVTWQTVGSIAVPDKDLRYPKVCMHPKSGEMVLTWTQYDKYGSDDQECKSTIMLSQSKDGKKWSTPILINQLAGKCNDDNLTPAGATPGINTHDMRFVAWSMNQQMYLDRSLNKGSTWLTNDIYVSNQRGGWSFAVPGLKKASGLPTLLVDNSTSRYVGSLFLSWADQSKGSGDTDVWFMRSTNMGDNWTTPLRVNNDDVGKHQFMPAMAIDQSDGSIYIAYYDRRDHDDELTDVYLAYSTDNGSSFKNVKISESSFTLPDNLDSTTFISIDAHKGIIVPAWLVSEDGKITIKSSIIKLDVLNKTEVK